MNRIWILLAAVGLAVAGGYWIYRASASDETRIRWLLEGMAEGFNASSARATLAGISESFIEESTRTGRPELHQFLLYLFLQRRDSKTKEFKYRVVLEEPEIAVIDPEGGEASVTLRAIFSERGGDAWREVWGVRIEASLREEDGDWMIVRARHSTERGKRPF